MHEKKYFIMAERRKAAEAKNRRNPRCLCYSDMAGVLETSAQQTKIKTVNNEKDVDLHVENEVIGH